MAGAISKTGRSAREQRAEELCLAPNPHPKIRNRRVVPWEIRFWDKVEHRSDGCMAWIGATNSAGYAWFNPGPSGSNRGPVLGHRWLYESLFGQLPEGMVLDHLCRVVNCVNPDHLDPVTQQVNHNRGDGGKRWTCAKGHSITGSNSYQSPAMKGSHRCLTCTRESDRGNGRYTAVLPETVDAVNRLLKTGMRHRDIAQRVGCSAASVSRIKNGYLSKFMRDGYASLA